MKRPIRTITIIWLCLCIPQLLGLQGIPTKTVLSHSRKLDPADITPIRAFLARDAVLMEYAVGKPDKEFQLRVSERYWATIPINTVNSEKEGRWHIYRHSQSPISNIESLPKIPIVRLTDYQTPNRSTFPNKDSLLTYVIDHYSLPKPVIIIDPSVPSEYGFHLVGTRKLHDSYRGYWNIPRSQFTYWPTFFTHAWKLPFTCLLDYPTTIYIYLFAPRWPM